MVRDPDKSGQAPGPEVLNSKSGCGPAVRDKLRW